MRIPDSSTGLRAASRSEFVGFLRSLDRRRTTCQITGGEMAVVTRYLQRGVTVAYQACRKTSVGRIVQVDYAICGDMGGASGLQIRGDNGGSTRRSSGAGTVTEYRP